MKDTPILFTGGNVRGILADLKTQTRRVEKRFPLGGYVQKLTSGACEWSRDGGFDRGVVSVVCPYGKPGDRLWVKETWQSMTDPRIVQDINHVQYWADEADSCVSWRPSILMPRWASRIHLELTEVCMQQLHKIREEDAIAEGCVMDGALPKEQPHPDGGHVGWDSARDWYADLWNSINLRPSPVYAKVEGKRQIVSYTSYPWSEADFEEEYPGVFKRGIYRGKPIKLICDPWVWSLTFKRLALDTGA